MRETFLNYSLPDIDSDEVYSVKDVLLSGWLAKGPKTIEFEKRFAEYVGAKYAIGVNSCTAALHLSLYAAGVGHGDEVITTPMTFAASANTIIQVGATPVFVDINESGCIDVNKIENRITSKTKAIVPVHYSGQACDLDVIYTLADKYNLFVSEDAAHAIDTYYKGNRIGNNPKGAVSYSFYATKNLSTGEGGMLVTDNETLANRVRVLVTHGMSRNAWNRYDKGGSWMYDIIEPGFKYNMFDLQAALGLVQLERMDEMQLKRKELITLYEVGLSDIKGLTLPKPSEYTEHSWHLYIVHVDENETGITRDEFIERLKEYNIGTSVHFIPVHLMSYYRRTYGYKEGDFPLAEKWFNEIVSLPLYSKMTHKDVNDVIEAVRKIIALQSSYI
ncbi:DegT/DnrJ/EryC1/StrS family aminotransferase [Paenibacillus sp. HJGM_3]|uniref:DegT/DnrJ/EryC1/StrS family aminotransferase n=1 Tax=Paenibacillus sp. HJGM_3 TaxID=3379816 RepID=UPI00385AAA53